MKLIFALAMVCGAMNANDFHSTSTDSIQASAHLIAPKTIQILLEKDISEALLEVKGPYYIFNPQDGCRVASGLLGKRFMIREKENGLKWGEAFPGIHQIYIRPRSPDTSIFINGIQYAGSIAIYGVNGMINIVNELNIESYVKSLLTTQFPAPLEPEVMSALAILERTNAYYLATKNPDSFWHTTASESGYSGSALVIANSPIDRAVDSTKNLILTRPQGDARLPFATAWTEHSAGKTAGFEIIFRKEGDAPEKGVDAPHAALGRQDSKWTYQITKKNLARLLDIERIEGIDLFVDAPSGKVYGLRIKGGDDAFDLDFLSFQHKLGDNHLRSSDFTLALKEDSVFFTGYGKGSGVGLCLYSASALAQNGENAVKILSKFFPDSRLHNLNVPLETVAH